MSVPGIIAIDGPTGAGKTTLGEWLGDVLDRPCFETGFVYRGAALRALEVPRAEWSEHLFDGVEVVCDPGQGGAATRLVLDGVEQPAERIAAADVDSIVAEVAAVPAVRARAQSLSRKVVGAGPMIVIGRDVGTSIVPEAGLKLYLTADRATRLARIGERSGGTVSGSERDTEEQQYLASHLLPDTHADVIDTTHRGIEEVREIVATMIGLQHEAQ